MAAHLWQPKHSYYCSERNYYSNQCHAAYDSWADFMAEEGDSDMDLNLVFRWDWKRPTDDNDRPIDNPDPYYRDANLQIFFVGQRKGLFRCAEVCVCRADEPAVKEWLAKRWEHLRALWAPVSTP